MVPFKIMPFQFYPLLLLLLPLFLQTVSTFPHKGLNLRINPGGNFKAPAANSKDIKTYFYRQTLDHFNYAPQSYATFRQRYVVNSKHWGGPKSNAPILAALGGEASIDQDYDAGFLSENAPYFKSLSVFIEHRYYGQSIPFGTIEEAMKNDTTRGYFNSAQAMADYAEILLHVKDKFSAHYSPIIVVGGSYAGMLASWFRLKYPHIAIGALASSAPILYSAQTTPQNGYYSIITKVFKEVSQNCYKTIRKSWAEIDKVASMPGGLSILSKRFQTCSPLKNASQLKDFLDNVYAGAAQYNLPAENLVAKLCKGIDEASRRTDVLGSIFAGVVSDTGHYSCYVNSNNPSSETLLGWQWQTCSELLEPKGRGGKDSMFPAVPLNLDQYIQDCYKLFRVKPRPHWITTYYGDQDLKLVLKRFGSNIIFSNGLKDPHSAGGVLEDLSESIVAVTTLNGSHCLDIYPAEKTDPEWLVMQRKKEVKIIKGWLTTYYADLKSLKKK